MAEPIAGSAGVDLDARTWAFQLKGAIHEVVNPFSIALALVMIVGTPLIGWSLVSGGAFRSSLELYGRLLTTPLIFVTPLFAVAFGCARMLAEVSHRHLVNVRTRTNLDRYVAVKVVAAGLAAFLPFLLLAVIPYVLVVGLGLVPEGVIIAPDVYEISADEAQVAAGEYATFTQLYAVSPVLYGLVFPVWVGVNGAACAALGGLALVAVPNRVVALIAPFALYFGESLVAGLLGQPQWALLFMVFPFGLEQGSLVIPTVALVALAAAIALLAHRGLGSRTSRERLT